ncbi:metalloendopeptidase-like membrane protein [Echinicola vietnamensis DSM 17526]|uniref:Metalloendopeptidase-like membrane protein n=1 Tax=Echinicola vietnamensis (strain DSM 17526 / LMG 23754 / KMM 6221) TaxID=926556 RepID=L0G0U5_ECHVK|nr:metalloendopeptidase-like membrane protein [Echinicola vietnamensis DSM 17526]
MLIWGWTESTLFAQTDKGYYQFPIKPGERNYLSGNMSEIRPNHFHSGIDIKTEGRQGLPIYAAADGYVYRMKVSSYGYGNVLYLKHPNGQYTLYGHLKDFNARIAKYMWQEMTAAEENDLEIYPDSMALPIKKGEIIAYSGNTGSSGGPHLHFEIRDSLDRALDPLKFGFSEVKDSTPPTVRAVAITPLTLESRINGKFERTVLRLNYRDNQFVVDGNLSITGKVGIEVSGYDKLDGAYNPNGFPHFEIYEEGQKTFDVNVDKIDFNLGRFLLTHTHENRYTKLYTTPYNQFDFYTPDSLYSGAIQVMPDSTKDVTVRLEDVFGNESLLKLTFKGEKETHDVSSYSASRKAIAYKGNWMIIRADKTDGHKLAKFYVNGMMMDVMMSYEDPRFRTYIWDMDFGLPDSVDICSEVIKPALQAKIPFNKEYYFNDGYTAIHFPKDALLETLFLHTERSTYYNRPSVKINDDRGDYLRNEISVSMDVSGYDGPIDHVDVYQLYGNGYKRFLGGEWNEGKINFKTKYFGTFVLVKDDTPPTIRPIRVSSSSLRFSIRDNLSGINRFEARINGKWVILRFEHKNGVIWTQKQDNTPFKGQFELKVTDNAGNDAVFSRKL